MLAQSSFVYSHVSSNDLRLDSLAQAYAKWQVLHLMSVFGCGSVFWQCYNHELSLLCVSFIFFRSEFREPISWTREWKRQNQFCVSCHLALGPSGYAMSMWLKWCNLAQVHSNVQFPPTVWLPQMHVWQFLRFTAVMWFVIALLVLFKCSAGAFLLARFCRRVSAGTCLPARFCRRVFAGAF